MADARRHLDLRSIARVGLAQLVVTAFVAAVAGITVVVSLALGAHGGPPVVALLVAAAVVTLGLPHVGSAAERLANGVVFGERADAYELVSDFVRSAASTLPIEEVLPRLAETAARSVRSPRGEVRVWLADGDQWREAWPVSPSGGAAAVNVDVRHDGRPVGELEVSLVDEEADAAAARRRLGALAGPAGLALSTVRLTVDLRRRLEELAQTEAELRASQRRLIEARLEERQRFVRTIDRFVNPHLEAATKALDAATGGGKDAETGLASAAAQGEVALDRLRAMAHGVFPVVLLQAGLAEALSAWAEDLQFALRVRSSARPELARRAPVAAAALYFCCVEALEHLEPPPDGATLEASEDDGCATMALEWTTTGSAQLDPDSALRLRDRTEAVGGTLVLSPSGLRVSVPTEVNP